jgi:hypothetical protein
VFTALAGPDVLLEEFEAASNNRVWSGGPANICEMLAKP